jgi:hypothetical protein
MPRGGIDRIEGPGQTALASEHNTRRIQLRRIIIIGTALAFLGGGVAALAAGSFNSYTVSEKFSPNAAGSNSHPSPFNSITEDWKAKGTGGHPTAPLTKIVAKVYGMKTNGKSFPVCTAAKINAAGNNGGWNKVCPKGSLIGQGPVNALFINPNPPYNSAGTCNPYLYIYNGGPTTQVFFFTEGAQSPNAKKYTCLKGSVPTGSAPAYNGHISYSGKTWVLTIPLPATVSTSAGGTGLYASLEHLHVVYSKATVKKGGKTISYGESVACSNGQRPYSFTFTAQNFNGQSPHTNTQTKTGSQKCS